MAQSLVVMTQQVWAGVIRKQNSWNSTPPCSSFLCSGKQLVAVHKAVMDLTADMGFLWFFAHLLLFHRAFASEGEFCAFVFVCVTNSIWKKWELVSVILLVSSIPCTSFSGIICLVTAGAALQAGCRILLSLSFFLFSSCPNMCLNLQNPRLWCNPCTQFSVSCQY